MKFWSITLAMLLLPTLCAAPAHARTTHVTQISLRSVVDAALRPLMAKDRIPGMAVAITVAGRAYVMNYGVASLATGRPVDDDTLFEIGSVSKTFTATLASWAQVGGRLALSDTTAKYFPQLQGTAFGNVTLLELGTHTPGGLPLQVPDGIRTDEQLVHYFQHWRPTYKPGTYRTYNNPGIGTLGLITAKALHEPFADLVQDRLFPALGIHDSFINIPAAKLADYAQGYTSAGAPIRMQPAELWQEAYGVKATASDLVRFVQENMDELSVQPALHRAIRQTHTGYFKAGPLTQDLIWEQYPYPVTLTTLLEGNATARIVFGATPTTKLNPPEPPQQGVWINKTGSTNGFSAYVAFIPEQRLGIVLLANKSIRLSERVRAAYAILTSVGHMVQGANVAPDVTDVSRIRPSNRL